MNDKKTSKIYEIIKTADGSPTLAWVSHKSPKINCSSLSTKFREKDNFDFKEGERMHSLHGAFSESLYIYGPCLEKAIESNHAFHKVSTKNINSNDGKIHKKPYLTSPRILSLGLGLGYNELITHGFLLKAKKNRFSLISFEKESELIHSFKSWLKVENFLSIPIPPKKFNVHGNLSDSQNFIFEKPDFPYETGLNQYYDEILKRVSKHFEQSPEKLKKFCYQSLKQDFFQISGSLPKKNPFDFGFTGILYDPFSNQSDPELWTTEHLRNFIRSYCDPKECFFATYAATGILKRVLKSEGFQFIRKKGFAGKRESTFAFRKL